MGTRFPTNSVLGGIHASFWIAPETRPGAGPGLWRRRALTAAMHLSRSSSLDNPSVARGLVNPPPVAKIETTDPFAAAFPGEFTEPSWFRTAVQPTPADSANAPGELSSMRNVSAGLFWPLYSTTTLAVSVPAIPYGTTALIWLF